MGKKFIETYESDAGLSKTLEPFSNLQTKAEMNTYKVEIFVDNTNGDDSNDGLTQQTPWKTISIDRVRERFGSPRVYYFTLLSDYDVEGHTVRIPRVEGTVRIASINSTRKNFYSSVDMPTEALITFSGNACTLENLHLYDSANVRVSCFLSVSCTQLYTNNCKFTSVNSVSGCFNCSRVDWFASNLYVDTNVEGETPGAPYVFSGNSTKIAINSGSINCTGFSQSFGVEIWMKNNFSFNYTKLNSSDSHTKPVIINRLCEIDDIGTGVKTTWSSDKISIEIGKLFSQLSPLTNHIDGKVWEEAFLDSSGNPTWLNDFIHTNIPVTPGETLYLCNAVSQLNCAFLAADGETILQYVSVATDEHGKFTVPSTEGIAYMSIPVRAGYAKNYIVAEEDIAFSGNIPDIYRGTPGYAPSVVAPTSGETRPDVLRFQVEKYDGSSSSTKYTFANCQDMIMNRLCGFVMLGYTSDYEVYCFSPSNGTIYKFNATTAASTVGSVAGLAFPSAIQNMTIYSSVGAGQRYTTANINPWRITFTQNSFLVRDLEGNTITEVPYSDIDAVLPTGKKMANLNKVVGTCYYINNNVYPSNAAFVSWRSTIPCSTNKIVVEKDTDATTWNRKEWFAYGTSMTADNNGYAPNLQALSGMILHNYGLGGSGIIPSLHPSDNVKTRCMRTTDGKANADLITIEIIPNDMSGELGTPTDTGDSTFLGNLNQIIQYLFENCPKAQIVILTATRSRRSLDGATEYDPQSEQAGKWLTWEDGIKEVCRRNGIQFWSGNDNCGLGYHRVKYATSGNTYVEDNIHLTDVGGKNLARYFFSKLKQLPLWYLPQ